MISFNVQRSKGASEVTAYDEAWAELKKIEKENPRVQFKEIFNEVDYTKAQYHSAMEAMVIGAVLAVFVVFLFLRDIRATLISSLAIPLSAIPAFWFMDMMGINLNFMSTMAMSLVAGVLVDDAIVEIENIVRHMRMGKSAYQASIDAADEIGLAVLATTMAIVAVFLPVALMPGISGQFFQSFGYTVVISVLMSLFVARMITPMIAAYFLRAHGVQPHAAGKTMGRYLSILGWSLDTSKAEAYRAKHPGFLRADLVAGPRSSLRHGPCRLRRLRHPDRLVHDPVDDLPAAARPRLLERRRQHAAGIDPQADRGSYRPRGEASSSRTPTSIACSSASSSATAGSRSSSRRTAPRPAPSSSGRLQPKLAEIADARVNFRSQSGGGPGDGGVSRDIMLFLGGDDPVKLFEVANKISDEMQTLPELRAPRVGGDLVRPEITIKPRFDLAADLGVTTSALSQTVRIATMGDIAQNSAKFSLSDRQVPITVAISENARRDLATLENLPVPTSSGGSVPLKSVAEIGFGAGPTTVQRTNQTRRIAVTADLAPGFVTGDVWPKINELPTMKNLPQGVTKLTLGDQKWQAELIFYFLVALGFGRVAGVRGAGAALSPLPRAAGQHGLAAARAVGRGDRAPCDRQSGILAGADRHPHAVRDRRQEFDPAGRFRGRDDGPWHAQERGDP